MFSGLLIILVPLIVGYLIPLRQQAALKVINQLLSWMVYLILFFMGISLAFLDNLASNLLAILHYSAVSITVILLCNIAALMWLERGLPWRNHHQQEKLPSRIAMALESLSGILLTESFGPVIGSAAFFNDLARELIAIMLIPGLIRRSRSTALGLCGATSMDFTLPVLQRTGGLDMVPAAIVHGFILSLLVPILIAFFSA